MKDTIDSIANRLLMFAFKILSKLVGFYEPELLVGKDSSLELVERIAKDGVRKLFIMTSAGIKRRGQLAPVIERLENHTIEVVVFDQVSPDPTFENVHQALDCCMSHQCNAVLALGGGSVIDAAKVVMMAATNGQNPQALVGIKKGRKAPLPFYSVPTTSGTGSEVTYVSVVKDSAQHRKQFVVDPKLVPIAAALDPALLVSMPPSITAMTGMDALTHAIEAYLSRNATPKTQKLSIEACQLIFDNLTTAYKQGENQQAREAMAVAAYKAGLAFTLSSLGYVHAISHQLGGIYGLPHGLGNAIVLPKVLKASFPDSISLLAQLAKETNIGTAKQDERERALFFIEHIEQLNKALGIPTVIELLQQDDIKHIAKLAYDEAKSSYAVPKFMSIEQCEALLRKCLVRPCEPVR